MPKINSDTSVTPMSSGKAIKMKSFGYGTTYQTLKWRQNLLDQILSYPFSTFRAFHIWFFFWLASEIKYQILWYI